MSCVSSQEISENSSEDIVAETKSEQIEQKEPTPEEVDRIKSLDLTQFEESTILSDASIYFERSGNCEKMFYLINKSREASIEVIVISYSSTGRNENEYSLSPRETVELGCGIDEEGNSVRYTVNKKG